MVKREQVVVGAEIQVNKVPPGPPGPWLSDKLRNDEKLTVLGTPYTQGGLNLVKVQRHLTGTQETLYYPFVTTYCRLAGTRGPKRVHTKASQSQAPTVIPTGEEVADLTDEEDPKPNE